MGHRVLCAVVGSALDSLLGTEAHRRVDEGGGSDEKPVRLVTASAFVCVVSRACKLDALRGHDITAGWLVVWLSPLSSSRGLASPLLLHNLSLGRSSSSCYFLLPTAGWTRQAAAVH